VAARLSALDRYAAEVQTRYQMTVPVFEELVRQGLLEEKFRKLLTDGISVGPAELQDEFRYKNEKVKLDYAMIKPETWKARITPDEAEIRAAYEKKQIEIPGARTPRGALCPVDVNRSARTCKFSDDMLKLQYQANIQQYQVAEPRALRAHLFMTVGKPDAESRRSEKSRGRPKAGQEGRKVRRAGEKSTSEDPGSKAKGGDLGWITQRTDRPGIRKDGF